MNIFIGLLLLFISVEVCSQGDMTWKPDGRVYLDNKVIKLKIQNAYFGYNFNNGIYIIGFEIDKESNNTPTLAWLNGVDKKPVYWVFDSVLQEIFVSDGQVNLLDIDGELYKLDQQQWVKQALKLKANSRIINADNGIIACNPSPLIKESMDYGSCYSVAGKWEVKVSWREIIPRLCGDYLVVVEESQDGLTLKKYNKHNGDLVLLQMAKKVPEDLCLFNVGE